MAELTDLPWVVSAYEGGWTCIRNNQGQIIAKLGLNVPTNAALIVKAVNMHERLVAALSWALDNADYRDSDASKRAFAILAETEERDDG